MVKGNDYFNCFRSQQETSWVARWPEKVRIIVIAIECSTTLPPTPLYLKDSNLYISMTTCWLGNLNCNYLIANKYRIDEEYFKTNEKKKQKEANETMISNIKNL